MNDTKDAEPAYTGFARVVCNTPTPVGATLTIGNVIVPFYEARIILKAGEAVRIEADIPVEKVDVQALLKHTELTIKGIDESSMLAG